MDENNGNKNGENIKDNASPRDDENNNVVTQSSEVNDTTNTTIEDSNIETTKNDYSNQKK